MRRAPLALIAIVVLAALGGWLWLSADDGDDDADQKARIAVQTASVVRASVDDVREFSGTLEAGHTLTIAPKIAGRIADIAVDIGDTVTRGDTLVQLDDDEYRQAVNEASAMLEVAQAQLKQAQSQASTAARTLSRVRALNERGIAATSELDAAQADAASANSDTAVARAGIGQARAQLATARLQLGYTDIHADWSGDDGTRVVGQRMAEPGDTVAANTPLMRVVSVAPLTAVIQVPEQLFPRLELGQSATLRIAGGSDMEFAARIARIAPVFDPDTRRARIELTVPNGEGRLAPGMFVQVGLVARTLVDTPIVPRSALVTRDERRGVFVISEASPATAQFVPVEVAFLNGNRAAIDTPSDLAGSVVVLGQAQLETGMAVAPETEEVQSTP